VEYYDYKQEDTPASLAGSEKIPPCGAVGPPKKEVQYALFIKNLWKSKIASWNIGLS
jgi:hypothetical protein